MKFPLCIRDPNEVNRSALCFYYSKDRALIQLNSASDLFMPPVYEIGKYAEWSTLDGTSLKEMILREPQDDQSSIVPKEDCLLWTFFRFHLPQLLQLCLKNSLPWHLFEAFLEHLKWIGRVLSFTSIALVPNLPKYLRITAHMRAYADLTHLDIYEPFELDLPAHLIYNYFECFSQEEFNIMLNESVKVKYGTFTSSCTPVYDFFAKLNSLTVADQDVLALQSKCNHLQLPVRFILCTATICKAFYWLYSSANVDLILGEDEWLQAISGSDELQLFIEERAKRSITYAQALRNMSIHETKDEMKPYVYNLPIHRSFKAWWKRQTCNLSFPQIMDCMFVASSGRLVPIDHRGLVVSQPFRLLFEQALVKPEMNCVVGNYLEMCFQVAFLCSMGHSPYLRSNSFWTKEMTVKSLEYFTNILGARFEIGQGCLFMYAEATDHPLWQWRNSYGFIQDCIETIPNYRLTFRGKPSNPNPSPIIAHVPLDVEMTGL